MFSMNVASVSYVAGDAEGEQHLLAEAVRGGHGRGVEAGECLFKAMTACRDLGRRRPW